MAHPVYINIYTLIYQRLVYIFNTIIIIDILLVDIKNRVGETVSLYKV